MQVSLLQNRNNELRELNTLTNEIEEIHDIFIDLSFLVNEQGETIDNIQTNVEETKQNTSSANTQLIKAKKYQKRKRKYLCITISIYSSIFFFICLILILSLSTNNN